MTDADTIGRELDKQEKTQIFCQLIKQWKNKNFLYVDQTQFLIRELAKAWDAAGFYEHAIIKKKKSRKKK